MFGIFQGNVKDIVDAYIKNKIPEVKAATTGSHSGMNGGGGGRGMGGGVSLGLPPDDITLLRVVEAVDGPIVLNHCLLRAGTCEREPECAAHEAWAEIQARLVQDLDAVTMKELSERQIQKKKARSDGH